MLGEWVSVVAAVCIEWWSRERWYRVRERCTRGREVRQNGTGHGCAGQVLRVGIETGCGWQRRAQVAASKGFMLGAAHGGTLISTRSRNIWENRMATGRPSPFQ